MILTIGNLKIAITITRRKQPRTLRLPQPDFRTESRQQADHLIYGARPGNHF